MKNSIIFVSAFSVVSIMMVSCASEPQTTTTATHQTTTTAATTADHRLPNQPTGYGDIGAGGAHLGGPGAGW
jgi:hypothetical protein